MTIHKTSGQASVWSTKTLIAGLLLVAAMVLASMTAAASARASTTFVVNGTGDAPDASTTASACDTDPSTTGKQCTLRAAIKQANAIAGADTINFAIPGTGVKTIAVNSTGLGSLPRITEQLTIDGYTQTGAHPNTKAVGNDAVLRVVLDGAKVVGGSGLEIEGASNCLIKGLVINGFPASGIDVFSFSADPLGNRIQGNFLGTNAAGTLAKGNGLSGISAFANDISGTAVGGTTPAARNLISGNENSGVDMGDTSFGGGSSLSEGIRVQGNYIGTDRSGEEDLGNGLDGVFLEFASGAKIGGTTASSRNVVSGNGLAGVDFFDVSDTPILGNRIGTTADGTGDLGNDLSGVFVDASIETDSFNQIGDGTAGGSNALAFNGDDGVYIEGTSDGNEVLRNSIFSNGGLGIHLQGPGENFSTDVSTPNDPFDTDAGPNGLQNRPVVTSARTGSLKTTIRGRLESAPDRTYTVEFYANPSSTNEGKKFIGQTTFTTSVDGLREFAFSPATKVPAGQTITATATNDSTHDTSEFSAPRTVVPS